MKKIRIEILPNKKIIDVRPNVPLLSALRQARVAIPSRCGGKGSCSTCKVKVASPADLGPLTRSEQRLLTEQEIQDGTRLACQVKVTDAAVISIPESPLDRVIKKMREEENLTD